MGAHRTCCPRRVWLGETRLVSEKVDSAVGLSTSCFRHAFTRRTDHDLRVDHLDHNLPV